jgi:hypothetical protein
VFRPALLNKYVEPIVLNSVWPSEQAPYQKAKNSVEAAHGRVALSEKIENAFVG